MTNTKWMVITEDEVAILKEAMFYSKPEDDMDDFDEFARIYAKLLEVEKEFKDDRIKRNETQEI